MGEVINGVYEVDVRPGRLVMDAEAFDLVFRKAEVTGPKRHRKWESILGILSFSRKHHEQALRELGARCS